MPDGKVMDPLFPEIPYMIESHATFNLILPGEKSDQPYKLRRLK